MVISRGTNGLVEFDSTYFLDNSAKTQMNLPLSVTTEYDLVKAKGFQQGSGQPNCNLLHGDVQSRVLIYLVVVAAILLQSIFVQQSLIGHLQS